MGKNIKLTFVRLLASRGAERKKHGDGPAEICIVHAWKSVNSTRDKLKAEVIFFHLRGLVAPFSSLQRPLQNAFISLSS